jgi:hypothetical protein
MLSQTAVAIANGCQTAAFTHNGVNQNESSLRAKRSNLPKFQQSMSQGSV